MSIDNWMDKEVVVSIHNETVLSREKECIWVCSNEVDEPKACYTEWSTSERERQVYINAYVWNLERVPMTLRAGHQRRHRHKEQILDAEGEGEGGMAWENSIETYTLPYIK